MTLAVVVLSTVALASPPRPPLPRPDPPVCMLVEFPQPLSAVARDYLADGIVLKLHDDLAPIIGDTTKMPGHPRRLVTVLAFGLPATDYAAWWPRARDSVAIMWRFRLNRGAYVAAAVLPTGDLDGRLFLTLGQHHEPVIPFRARRVRCPPTYL